MPDVVPLNQRLVLNSDTSIEEFVFYENDNVSATLGEKGGFVCAPILKFEVTGPDSIKIFGAPVGSRTWSNIRVQGDQLFVECNGYTQAFAIHNPPPRH